MAIVLPKDNPFLIGHEKAEKLFLEAFKRQTLHHAFLISGIEGIGKATFAYRIARFLLSSDVDKMPDNLNILPTNPVFMQIASGANPNFKVIERGYTENDEKKIIKAIKDGQPLEDEDLQNLKKSTVIKVDDVREINQFLAKKSFDGAWRVVLIDSVDDLNTASANAVLKILEEPPEKSILLLVSHQPNKLLATIRSRCVKLHLEPLSCENVSVLLRRYMPDLNEKEVQQLSSISGGSIGKALKYAANNGLKIYTDLQQLMFKGSAFNLSKACEMAEFASANDDMWQLTLELMLQLISDLVKSGEKGETLVDFYQTVLQSAHDVSTLNMDKKQTFLNLIYGVTSII